MSLSATISSGPAPLFAGKPRATLDTVWVRVQLTNGLVGWGEAYAADVDAVVSILQNRVAPLAMGRDASDLKLTATLERTLHNMGRSGPVLHALSGLDIALWDLRAKPAGVPLYELLGGARRKRVPAYASLLQYNGDEDLVRRTTARALAAGYTQVKLHERTAAAVLAARAEAGRGVPLMLDTNCAWDLETGKTARLSSAICSIPPFAQSPFGTSHAATERRHRRLGYPRQGCPLSSRSLEPVLCFAVRPETNSRA